MTHPLLPFTKSEHAQKPTLDLSALIHLLVNLESDAAVTRNPNRRCQYKVKVGAHTLEADEIYGVSINGYDLDIPIALVIRFQNYFRGEFLKQEKIRKDEFLKACIQ